MADPVRSADIRVKWAKSVRNWVNRAMNTIDFANRYVLQYKKSWENVLWISSSSKVVKEAARRGGKDHKSFTKVYDSDW